jgi:drug/metabolite transporter (DMT)-like permease
VLLSAFWLGERLGLLKMLGMLIGFAGIVLVIGERGIGISGVDPAGFWFCVASLLAISAGTIYQKRHCAEFDLLPGVLVQYIAAGLFYWTLAFLFEQRDIYWTPRFLFALGWLVLVLSLGAVLLLMWLIRNGEAGRVASLFYLVPPFVTIEAWLLFDEHLSPLAIGGIALCVVGVAMVMRAPARS